MLNDHSSDLGVVQYGIMSNEGPDRYGCKNVLLSFIRLPLTVYGGPTALSQFPRRGSKLLQWKTPLWLCSAMVAT